MENWKPIEGFPGYDVSDLGRVRRVAVARGATVGKLLRPSFDKGGYLHVSLSKDDKKTTKQVHGLVARAFNPNPLGLPDVNHMGKKSDNRATKLEWRSKAGHGADRAVRRQQGKGVRFSKSRGGWRYCLSFMGKNMCDRIFKTKEEALHVQKKMVAALPYIQ